MARRPREGQVVWQATPRPRTLKRIIEGQSSYAAVARAADLGKTTLYLIANGSYLPSRDQEEAVERAFKALGLPPAEMWWEDGVGGDVRPPSAVRAERERHERHGAPAERAWERETIMLSDEALAHFHLERDPFVNELEEEADLFLDDERKGLRARLLRGIQRQHFIALVGPVGAGKTTILDNVRYWLLRQDRYDLVELANVDRPALRVVDVIQAIITTLSVERPRNSCEARSRQARRILVESRDRDRFPVIVIDEAQNVPAPTLRALKVIYDHKEPRLGYRRLVSIILAGQSGVAVAGEHARDLLAKLRSPSLEEVAARVYVLRLPELGKRLGDYVRWKFKRVGGDGFVAADALKRLAALRIDTPAKVARAMPAVLEVALEVGDRKVTAEHVDRALFGGTRGRNRKTGTADERR